MRAKRSKKYRKIMESYSQVFTFHEPYQVILDAAFLRTTHKFHMPLQRFLDNTLHSTNGCKMLVSQCTLAKIMKDHGTSKTRPDFLPPPTEVPLRYCKHEDKSKQEGWTEADCLMDLLGGMATGNEVRKNKWHYILATADAETEQRRPRGPDIRERARQIPGVPVVYVKRSVMVLEEMSGASLAHRNGLEREKFREGIVGGSSRKRQRGDEEDEENPLKVEREAGTARRGMQRPKGPNPLSVRSKKKEKKEPATERQDGKSAGDDNTDAPKAKRRRKHRSKKSEGGGVQQDKAVEV